MPVPNRSRASIWRIGGSLRVETWRVEPRWWSSANSVLGVAVATVNVFIPVLAGSTDLARPVPRVKKPQIERSKALQSWVLRSKHHRDHIDRFRPLMADVRDPRYMDDCLERTCFRQRNMVCVEESCMLLVRTFTRLGSQPALFLIVAQGPQCETLQLIITWFFQVTF